MSKTSSISVGELIRIFQEALGALLPSMEKAHIAWGKGEAYDEWDEIAHSLFRNIVVRSLYWELKEAQAMEDILPKYNTLYDSYRGRSVLEIRNTGEVGTCVFVGLSASHLPFDTVDYVVVGPDGLPRNTQCKNIPLSVAELAFSIYGRTIVDVTI